MRLLKVTLILKILLTIAWSASLLIFSKEQFADFRIPEPKPMLFTRLLGAAFLALLLGYVLGLRELGLNKTPFNTILVGIVSNSLACIFLVYFGLNDAWSEWSVLARYCMWASAFFTGLITILLCVSFLRLRGDAPNAK